jgi:drug/metabolite transporter (DMT)-like permease
MDTSRMWTICLTLACVLATAAAQIFLKVGVSGRALQAELHGGETASFLVRALLNPWVLAGLALYVISTVVWLIVLGRVNVSYAYPFVSLGFVFTAAYAYFGLHEPMAPARIAGVVLIMGGVYLVARS